MYTCIAGDMGIGLNSEQHIYNTAFISSSAAGECHLHPGQHRHLTPFSWSFTVFFIFSVMLYTLPFHIYFCHILTGCIRSHHAVDHFQLCQKILYIIFLYIHICTVLQTQRVHFAFWHKLVYNFKTTSSVLKKKLIEIYHNLL